MSRLIKVIDNENIEISDYRCSAILYHENPPTLQNIKDQIEHCEDWCVFKETINPFVLYSEKQQLQSNWNSLKELISGNKRIYEDSNKSLEDTFKILNSDLPPRYYMNNGCLEMTDYLLDKINELEGKDKE